MADTVGTNNEAQLWERNAERSEAIVLSSAEDREAIRNWIAYCREMAAKMRGDIGTGEG